jgi:hypothetical protein
VLRAVDLAARLIEIVLQIGALAPANATAGAASTRPKAAMVMCRANIDSLPGRRR